MSSEKAQGYSLSYITEQAFVVFKPNLKYVLGWEKEKICKTSGISTSNL